MVWRSKGPRLSHRPSKRIPLIPKNFRHQLTFIECIQFVRNKSLDNNLFTLESINQKCVWHAISRNFNISKTDIEITEVSLRSGYSFARKLRINATRVNWNGWKEFFQFRSYELADWKAVREDSGIGFQCTIFERFSSFFAFEYNSGVSQMCSAWKMDDIALAFSKPNSRSCGSGIESLLVIDMRSFIYSTNAILSFTMNQNNLSYTRPDLIVSQP